MNLPTPLHAYLHAAATEEWSLWFPATRLVFADYLELELNDAERAAKVRQFWMSPTFDGDNVVLEFPPEPEDPRIGIVITERIAQRECRLRVLALFREVEFTCPNCEGNGDLYASTGIMTKVQVFPCWECNAKGWVVAPDLLPPEPSSTRLVPGQIYVNLGPQTVRITGEVVPDTGRYPAVEQRFNPETGQWIDGDSVWVEPAPRPLLTQARLHLIWHQVRPDNRHR